MPDSGLRAPARTLVAVRAIVPVTLMPPNSAEAILAMPCATSSMFGAVIAAGHAVGDLGRQQALDAAEQGEGERRPAGAAAARSSERRRQRGRRQAAAASRRSGCRSSRPAGATAPPRPRRAPRRSACRATSAASAAPEDDRRDADAGRQRGGLKRRQRPPSAASLGSSGPGSAPARCRPPRSFIWLAKMVTAMPAVKPTVDGMRDMPDQRARAARPHQRQHQARQQDGQQQARRGRTAPPSPQPAR